MVAFQDEGRWENAVFELDLNKNYFKRLIYKQGYIYIDWLCF